MGRLPLILLPAVLLIAAPAASPLHADTLGSSVVKPYLFNPPDRPTNPLDQQKALIYRDQLRAQERDLEMRGAERPQLGVERGLHGAERGLQGLGPRPFESDRLRETRRELYRMDNIINDRPPVETQISPPPVPGQRVPGVNPFSFESGGHPQPTPGEVERREAVRAETGRAPPPERPLTPAEIKRREAASANRPSGGRQSAPEADSAPETFAAQARTGPTHDLFGRPIQ